MTTNNDTQPMDGDENPLEMTFRSMQVRRENYEKDTTEQSPVSRFVAIP